MHVHPWRARFSAILAAPDYLSGPTAAEWNVVRARAREALHPEETEMQEQLTKAMDDVRAGVAATKRAILERCEILGDGKAKLRPNRELSTAIEEHGPETTIIGLSTDFSIATSGSS
ncbi:hypothetical protein [Bradyrhizobium sp. RP6]|uniref:hypothetical protein n=1 Tax=Bradyrhizobium sp. RP6 TaxID=2489596 RepID=UPI000F52C3AD|nr:hypothetical protein [Bradyrhizobium sp. RP6]RQH16491.1 hypothetical protein EHH60_04800 [Bradyrhizobium sp. RP6]